MTKDKLKNGNYTGLKCRRYTLTTLLPKQAGRITKRNV